MTFQQVYHQGKIMLQQAGIESPAFDAICLFRHVFGIDRQGLLLHGQNDAPPTEVQAFLDVIAQRQAHRPLQYILGEWEFLGMQLCVGEGVLIPREETELLVDTAVRQLSGRPAPLVADLCAGTGAVGLGVSRRCQDARVLCVEKYQPAMNFLMKNLERFGDSRISAVQADVLQPPGQQFVGLDAIVSNPPYIEKEELPGLQAEVQREPATALDGGGDGLDFYRAIAKRWVPRLKPGGAVAVEIGEKQANGVAVLFQAAGLKQIQVFQDFNGLDRVVSGVSPLESKE